MSRQSRLCGCPVCRLGPFAVLAQANLVIRASWTRQEIIDLTEESQVLMPPRWKPHRRPSS